ncbi:hypothetical protein C8R46DRAFT_1221835 [Mycena filopes]|nr:hypothetical protein C8R46DRAFT_1221835 [Mycena filopes]
MPSSPPLPYNDPDNDELQLLLDQLHLGPDTDTPLLSPNHRRHPSPRSLDSLSPLLRRPGSLLPMLFTLPHNPRRLLTGKAAHTQNVAGAFTCRLTSKSTAKRKSNGYTVFFGMGTGAFRSWYGEVEPLVKGVKNSLFQGYDTFAHAEEAYNYAAVRGWARILPYHPSHSVIQEPIHHLPTPIGLLDLPNPLHAHIAGVTGRWYIVYVGITPVVYQSSLECSLNTFGLCGSVFESCESKAEAIALFQQAVVNERVRSVAPVYT